MRANATHSQWSALRSVDWRPFAVQVIAVTDVAEALALAAEQAAEYDRIGSEHLVRRHGAIALADGRLALVLDEVAGGSLARLLGARGQLTAGEVVTIVAPLFRALADLHAAGVVHGSLSPGNILFTAEGKPLIADLGVACLFAQATDRFGGAGTRTGASAVTGSTSTASAGTGSGGRLAEGFSAPELADGALPSPTSDVYSLAALGWFCLTGAAPAPVGIRRSLTSLRPDTPLRLAEILTACLATNPAARPSCGAAAVEVFEAAAAESVALAAIADPGAEITRRIRAAAASDSLPVPSGSRKRYQTRMVVAVVAVLVVGLVAAGAAWFLRLPPSVAAVVVAAQPVTTSAHQQATLPSTAPTSATPTTLPLNPPATLPATMRRATQTQVVPARTSVSSADVLTSRSSPRVAAAGLLQALVDARALAYLTRKPAFLDLVYAPGAPKAVVDRGNIDTALKNGGTYLGLSFTIADVAFLGGASDSARIRATIITPAYQTGQPDGRRISHPAETLRSCIFSLSLTPDGWRVQALTTP